MALTFTTTIAPYGPAGAIKLTEQQAAQLGPGRQPPVCVTVGDATARVRVSRMGGEPCVFLSKANRQLLGVEIGDQVQCTIVRDTAERVVTPPQLLADALATDPDLTAAWQRLSYSHQREWAASIEEAKRPETKQRRLAQLRAKLLPEATASAVGAPHPQP